MNNDNAQDVTLDDIAKIVDLGECYRFPGDAWCTYYATITRRGRVYPVAKVTAYDDGYQPTLIRHDTLTTVAQREAWGALTDLYGMKRPEPWQTPYSMAPALSY